MVELYVVRHGETDSNSQKRLNGGFTDLPLNDVGVAQAKRLSKEINIEDFDEIYTSPLIRAKQTAEILNHGVHDVKVDERLIEARYGSWDGASEAELMSEYPEVFDENEFLFPEYKKYVSDGEDYDDVYKRVDEFISDMSKKGDKKIMAVCHGFISRSFLKVITGAQNISAIVQPDNAGVSKYRLSKAGTRFLTYYGRQTDID